MASPHPGESHEPLFAVKVMYEVYQGKNPITAKPTGRVDYRPPFYIRTHELAEHVADKYMRDRIANLQMGDGAVSDKHGNIYYRER